MIRGERLSCLFYFYHSRVGTVDSFMDTNFKVVTYVICGLYLLQIVILSAKDEK